jgi:hypothetical protein
VINIQLDYSSNSPVIKIFEDTDKLLFVISLPSENLVEITSDTLEIENLDKDIFGDFQ